jgi:hypothetical protein
MVLATWCASASKPVQPEPGSRRVQENQRILQPRARGDLNIYPGGSTRQEPSSFSFAKGQTISNLSVDQVGPDERVRVLNGSAGQVNVIADAAGCYLDGT